MGVGAFDATVNDDEPDSRFLAWRGQVLYLRQLGAEKGSPAIAPTLLIRSDVQLAIDSLVPLEQFSIGGFESVRGYRQGALLTDNGALVSAEVRLPIARVSKVKGTLQVAPFIDGSDRYRAGNQKEFIQT